MAQQLIPPVFFFANSAGQPYAGGSLTFSATGTSTPLDTYPTEADLIASTNANSNPVTLNSAGWPAVSIFLQNLPYRVVLKDSSGNTIWTRDNVRGTDFSSVPLWTTLAGDPNGQLAGTASSSGVLPSMAWDRTNSIMYVCTTTGNAAAAVWTAINGQSVSAQVVTAPQGYLTLTSGTPVIAADVSAATAVYYTPFVGNLVPVYNGIRFIPTEFSELTLTLVASHLANQIYDVFGFDNSGTLTIGTGPAWATPTAGSGARGTGAGTTQLTRLNGYWVNAVAMTARNSSSTYSVAANQGTYLGSIFMDGSNGQVTCHTAFGQSRKWGVWNAYNRQPILLRAGDSTANWSYNTGTVRPSNNATANSLTVFQGLAEERYDLMFTQSILVTSNAGGTVGQARMGIGWNSTTATSGKSGKVGFEDNDDSVTVHGTAHAAFLQVPSIGIHVVTALETAAIATGAGISWLGSSDDMLLAARWRG